MENEQKPDVGLTTKRNGRSGKGNWLRMVSRGPFRFVLMPLFLVALLLSAVLTPLWVPVAVLIRKREDRRFQRRMRAKGRFIAWKELEPALIEGRGTFIIQQMNKGPIDFWWTPEDLASTSPFDLPGEHEVNFFLIEDKPHPFVSWCESRFLDPANGTALLTVPEVDLPPGLGLASFFRELYPKLLAIDTAFCLLETLHDPLGEHV